MFFIHPGGGGAASYSELASLLSKDQPFYCIESYNLYSGKSPIVSIEKLAAKYLSFIDSVISDNKDLPIFLGGWSLGGLIAFEIARQATDANIKIGKIYMLDTFLNDAESTKLQNEIYNEEFIEEMLAGDEFLSSLPLEHLEKIIKISKIENKGVSEYSPKFSEVEIFLFKAESANDVPESIPRAIKNTINKLNTKNLALKKNGWEEHAKHIRVKTIKANHENIMEKSKLKQIAKAIQNDMEHTDGK